MSIKIKIEEQLKINDYEDAINFLHLYSPKVCLRMISEDKQKEFLELSNNYGWTVAHEMAFMGYEFTDPGILKLADDWGRTVAHGMALRGYEFTDPEVLKLGNKGGWAVAHMMTWNGYKFTNPEILKLSNKDGRTVAHQMALKGYEFTNPGVLQLADDLGQTVAHEMAARGHEFTDPEILKLANKDGWTVADCCDWVHNTDKFNKLIKPDENIELPGFMREIKNKISKTTKKNMTTSDFLGNIFIIGGCLILALVILYAANPSLFGE